MEEILTLLPVLFVAIMMNIGTGIYYNIGTQNLSFDFKKLLFGLIKACLISSIFIGLSYCFESTDLSSIGVTPTFLMNSAIILYVSKTLVSLGKILGVDIHTNKEA